LLVLHSVHLNNDSLIYNLSNPNYGECNCSNYTDWFDAGNVYDTQVLSVFPFHLTTICDQYCDMFCPQRTNSTTKPFQYVIQPNPNGIYNWDNGTSVFLVNNQYLPKITISKNEWTRFRIVNADAQGSYMLNFTDLAGYCEYYYIAADGIFFQKARNLKEYPYDNYVYSSMAGRIEVIIKCNTSGTYNVGHITNAKNYSQFLPIYQANFTFFTIVVDGTDGTNGDVNPNELKFPPYSGYLEDTTNLTRDQYKTTFQCGNFYNASVATDISWSVWPDPQEAECSQYELNITNAAQLFTNTEKKYLYLIGKAFGINNQSFRDSRYLARMLANETYQFNVNFQFHPFHHHINPYQIQDNLTYGFIAQKGEWRDVVSNIGSYSVRTRTRDFTGKVIMHCHFLPHEDRGLMGYYQITTNTTECTNSKGAFLPVTPDSNCQQTRLSDFCFDTTTSSDSNRNIISIFYFWFVSSILLWYLF